EEAHKQDKKDEVLVVSTNNNNTNKGSIEVLKPNGKNFKNRNQGSLSGDCDAEKNGKWSCIYVVGSREYQMVCTRLDIASVDVGMLDKFDHGLQTDVQVFVDFDYAMGRSITIMSRSITVYGLMILGCA
nr:zinc finger, CCHC-type [Tanacetum cinerariifolium]